MRPRIVVRKTTLDHLDDEFDRKFWSSLSASDKWRRACELSEEIWRLRGWRPDERGLSRSHTRVVRR